MGAEFNDRLSVKVNKIAKQAKRSKTILVYLSAVCLGALLVVLSVTLVWYERRFDNIPFGVDVVFLQLEEIIFIVVFLWFIASLIILVPFLLHLLFLKLKEMKSLKEHGT